MSGDRHAEDKRVSESDLPLSCEPPPFCLEGMILSAAEAILHRRLCRLGSLRRPDDTAAFLRMRLGHLDREEFHAVWLDSQHQILAVERLFEGSLDGAAVYPREVVRSAIAHNAAAVIFAHNHPSGNAEPSAADQSITDILKQALRSIAVRVLDHMVVTAGDTVSMANRGLL